MIGEQRQPEPHIIGSPEASSYLLLTSFLSVSPHTPLSVIIYTKLCIPLCTLFLIFAVQVKPKPKKGSSCDTLGLENVRSLYNNMYMYMYISLPPLLLPPPLHLMHFLS